MILPKLYKLTSTGKVQEWEIRVVPQIGFDVAQIITVYGQTDGKKQEASEFITEGKNTGKANETTPLQQAEAEAKSQWEKKVKKGYVQNIKDAQQKKVDTNMITGGIDPMLAHSYDKQGHKIKWPAYVQPKLDGHRCIAIIQDGKATLWSRTRKRITSMPHIVDQLERIFGGIHDKPLVLDGELYNHSYREKFEELTSLIRQQTPAPGHGVIEYWIYDVVDQGNFEHRAELLYTIHELLAEYRTDVGESIRVLNTYKITSQEEMVTKFGKFIDAGFEGAMVRNANGLYKHGRSYDLLKVKLMQDAEYKIVAVEEGRGKMAGRAMFVCETENGQCFRVKMKGALDDLKNYFENPEPWIGRMLTVQFQKFSAEGIPIFPVALRFRDDV